MVLPAVSCAFNSDGLFVYDRLRCETVSGRALALLETLVDVAADDGRVGSKTPKAVRELET